MGLSIFASCLLWLCFGLFLARLWEVEERNRIAAYIARRPEGVVRDEGPVDTEVISMVMWADLD
jgi:hypothetical protein